MNITRWDVRTSEKTQKALEALHEKISAQQAVITRLRGQATQLDADLFSANNALELERGGRKAAEREGRTLARFFEDRVKTELDKRPQDRLETLENETATLKTRVLRLSGVIEDRELEIRSLNKDFAARVDERKRELDAEYRHKLQLLKDQDEADKARIRELEESYRLKTAGLTAERERLQGEISDQKKLLGISAAGLADVRKQLERRETGDRDEHKKKLEALDRAKAKFTLEAEWLQRRIDERKALWEADLKTKLEKISVLEDQVELLVKTASDKEREHRETAIQKENQFRETLEQMSQSLKEAEKRRPGPRVTGTEARTGDAALSDLPEFIGTQSQATGITPQDLVFGLAHQIRNPLAIIKTHAEFCMRKFSLSAKDKAPLEAIVRNCKSLGKRLDDLVDLTRPRTLRAQPTNLRQVLEQVIILILSKAQRQSVEVERAYPEEPTILSLDVEQFKEALLHVIVNALEAMPKGGTLGLGVTPLADKDMVRIDISDTGPGIDPEHRGEIFRPFFSMKPGGVGLGLTLATQIIDLHGGSIEAESAQGKGTMIKFYLPLPKER